MKNIVRILVVIIVFIYLNADAEVYEGKNWINIDRHADNVYYAADVEACFEEKPVFYDRTYTCEIEADALCMALDLYTYNSDYEVYMSLTGGLKYVLNGQEGLYVHPEYILVVKHKFITTEYTLVHVNY